MPEILSKRGYDGPKVDICSCGVVLFALNAGYLSFNHPNLITMYKRICHAQYRCPRWTSPNPRHLISRIFDPAPDPNTGITLNSIIAHPWFAGSLDVGAWTALMCLSASDDNKEAMEELMDQEGRPLNTFNSIVLAPDWDLSSLFSAVLDRDRFV